MLMFHRKESKQIQKIIDRFEAHEIDRFVESNSNFEPKPQYLYPKPKRKFRFSYRKAGGGGGGGESFSPRKISPFSLFVNFFSTLPLFMLILLFIILLLFNSFFSIPRTVDSHRLIEFVIPETEWSTLFTDCTDGNFSSVVANQTNSSTKLQPCTFDLLRFNHPSEINTKSDPIDSIQNGIDSKRETISNESNNVEQSNSSTIASVTLPSFSSLSNVTDQIIDRDRLFRNGRETHDAFIRRIISAATSDPLRKTFILRQNPFNFYLQNNQSRQHPQQLALQSLNKQSTTNPEKFQWEKAFRQSIVGNNPHRFDQKMSIPSSLHPLQALSNSNKHDYSTYRLIPRVHRKPTIPKYIPVTLATILDKQNKNRTSSTMMDPFKVPLLSSISNKTMTTSRHKEVIYLDDRTRPVLNESQPLNNSIDLKQSNFSSKPNDIDVKRNCYNCTNRQQDGMDNISSDIIRTFFFVCCFSLLFCPK